MIRAFVTNGKRGFREENNISVLKKLLRSQKNNVWVDFENPTRKEIGFLESEFGFHPLTVEDILHGRQRPKVEDYQKYAFIIMRAFKPNATSTEQLSVYLGKNFIFTVNLKPIESLNNVFDRARKNPLILKRGPDFVLYTVMDSIADDLFPRLDAIGIEIDEVEDKIFTQPDNHVLAKLFSLKRKTIKLRRLSFPMREIANTLARRDFKFMSEHNSAYFRDVYDHLLRITESTESNRELIASSMEAYLSVISNNLNSVMKKLASITVIIMLPTLIASIYGMNIRGLILANDPLSFEIILGIMAIAAMGSYYHLHKINWI